MSCRCSISNSSAACAKGELVAPNGRTWTLRTKPSPSANGRAKQRRRAGHHAPENRKIPSAKFPFRKKVDLLIAEHQKHPSNPWMFPSPKTGEIYHPDSVVNIHKKILKDAGLEHLRFHDLRHTFATLALQNGVDVKTYRYARPFRRRVYPSHLHPRHAADAGKRRRKDGQFHGAGHVNTQKNKSGGEETIILSAAL